MKTSLLPHHVRVEPIPDIESTGGITIPEHSVQAHAQRGWVLEVSETLEEHIEIGDLVIFVGWKETRIRKSDQQPHLDDYSMHEDDIELVVASW